MSAVPKYSFSDTLLVSLPVSDIERLEVVSDNPAGYVAELVSDHLSGSTIGRCQNCRATMLLGGGRGLGLRADSKTCSDACRSALRRQRKAQDGAA